MDRLGEPHAVGVDLGDLLAGALPELDGDERRHVAAEAVDHASPVAQRLHLVVPQPRRRVVEVDDVGPVAHAVAWPAVGLVVEELGMMLPEHGIGGGVVVHHVDHAAHSIGVDGVDEGEKIVERSVLGIDGAIVSVGVGAAEFALSVEHPDWMDGHEPDVVGTEGGDARQVGDDRAKRALGGVVAYEDRVDDLVPEREVGRACHRVPPSAVSKDNPPILMSHRPGSKEETTRRAKKSTHGKAKDETELLLAD